MNKEIFKAIRLLNEHSLSVISTDRQINNGTIMVEDDFKGTNYTIHASGYARKRVTGGYNQLNHYQLNKVRKVTKLGYKGYAYSTTERILIPGQYMELAEMVINAANRERLKEDESFTEEDMKWEVERSIVNNL